MTDRPDVLLEGGMQIDGKLVDGVGRQNGIAGFEQYTEIKSVAYPAS